VSDFPPVDIRNKDLLSVETSTPLSKRTRQKYVSVTGDASDVTEDEYEEENGREGDTDENAEESKTEGDSEESDNEEEENSNYSKVGDLSAIHEQYLSMFQRLNQALKQTVKTVT
jgi:hypothetical protein